MRACDRCGERDSLRTTQLGVAFKLSVSAHPNDFGLGQPDLCDKCIDETIRDLTYCYGKIMDEQSPHTAFGAQEKLSRTQRKGRDVGEEEQ